MKSLVVIIGGGPAGLATAIALAKRGWQNITVLEKRPTPDYYEPDKSYSYQIDGRGQKLTDLLGLTSQLASQSVPNTEFYFTLISKNGNRKTRKVPIVDPKRKTAYWLPRQSLIQLFSEEIVQNWSDSIRILFATECKEIKEHPQGLEIIAQSLQEQEVSLTPTLLVGCDGLNSVVRQFLNQREQGKSQRFAMQKFPSASSGLKYKVLTFPPNFPLSDAPGDLAESTMAYAIRASFTGRRKAFSLGILPLKNQNQPRSANIITYQDHEIWQLKTTSQLEYFFKQAFAHLPLTKIISNCELERFLSSSGGVFPSPQYCSGLSQIIGKYEENLGTGVILFGDAVHCFPPDIGQGVNSALEDVYLFDEVLAQTKDNLWSALPLYQSLRENDVRALIRLVQICYPWQYNQAPLRQKLWSVNFFGRFLLNRLFPFLFNPHSFLLIQNHQLSYAEILAKSNQTTFRLTVGLLILLIGLYYGVT